MARDFSTFLESDRRAAASAFVKGDASEVAALSAQSGTATFFDPGGGFTKGAKAVNEANLKGAANFGPKSTTELDIMDQEASGELAFWAGYQTATMDVNGKMQEMNLRVTEVFRKRDGDWKLVHRHASLAHE